LRRHSGRLSVEVSLFNSINFLTYLTFGRGSAALGSLVSIRGWR
jgi:hypothetical protein